MKAKVFSALPLCAPLVPLAWTPDAAGNSTLRPDYDYFFGADHSGHEIGALASFSF